MSDPYYKLTTKQDFHTSPTCATPAATSFVLRLDPSGVGPEFPEDQ